MSVIGTLKTVKQVAVMLGVDEQTVRRWVKAGKLPVIRLPSRRYRIAESEIMKMQEKAQQV